MSLIRAARQEPVTLAQIVLATWLALLVPALAGPPTPLLSTGQPVDWWFVFKLNSHAFPACGAGAERTCPFGGSVQDYRFFGQQFLYASSADPSLKQGSGCAGDSFGDPIGATFDEVYDGDFFYIVWNDQFYDDPAINGCSKSCSAPFGHSKGLAAWDSSGAGFVMQVTTPSWPASGSKLNPRQTDGNTLGCVADDNVEVSQHFFALRLAEPDLKALLDALKNASIVTDPGNPQIVRNGGPPEIQASVNELGRKSSSTKVIETRLPGGIELISKPSDLHVPPWQMVSSQLGGVGLRTATWWAAPKIPSTDAGTAIACWDPALNQPGPVAIALSGAWQGNEFGLTGGAGPNFNHAKIGVSTAGDHPYVIFGDMNQQGSLDGPNCGSSQNGRGGLFFIMENQQLFQDVTQLIAGTTAPN